MAVGPNNWERGIEKLGDGDGSSILTILTMCGIIACSPAAFQFVSGFTLHEKRDVYLSELMRREP